MMTVRSIENPVVKNRMIIGYCTNGLAHHEMFDALNMMADIGYRSVAIDVDHLWLSPKESEIRVVVQRLKHFLDTNQFSSVIETGAKFLLNPTRKNEPTLLGSDPARVKIRTDFLKYCIDLAAELGSDCVSMKTGVKPSDIAFSAALDRFAKNLGPILEYAATRNIEVGVEPEPGMLVDSTGRFERLVHLIDVPHLKMTLDIGQLFCLAEVPLANYIEKWQNYIVNVHVEDMKAGETEHLKFGEGQIYFPPVIESLAGIGYLKGVHIELDRHSANAVETCRESFAFLNPIIQEVKTGKAK